MQRKAEDDFVYSVWWKNGAGGAVRRDALPFSHPESLISLWRNQYGDLFEFPWEDVYGKVPTVEEMYQHGIQECPVCGHSLKETH